jgi:UDP-glucose 4-epimerase
VAGAAAPEPDVEPAPIDELPRFAVSAVRARIHLGWAPWTDLADGLAQL